MLAERRSPRGFYQLLDDFTERVDTDVSNNAGMLGRRRAAAQLRPVSRRHAHRRAAEARAARRRIRRRGAGRAAVSADRRSRACCWPARPAGSASPRLLALGRGSVEALEPEPVLRGALRHGLGPSPALAADRGSRARATARSPRRGPAARTTSSTSRRISSTRRRPTAPPSPSRRSPPICARCTPGGIVSHPGLDPRLPGLCAADAGHRARGAAATRASATRRRMWWCTARPGACGILLSNAPWSAARIAAVRRVLRRALVRRLVLSRHRRHGGARATSTTTCRRFPSTPAR